MLALTLMPRLCLLLTLLGLLIINCKAVDSIAGERGQRASQGLAILYDFATTPKSSQFIADRSGSQAGVNRVREYEQRAYEMQARLPGAPQLPPKSRLLHGGLADPGGEGIDITLEELTSEWRLMADLYALAIELDRTRFGSITFLAAGERIRLTGEYTYKGETRFQFNDSAQHKSGGSKGCSHEWWHQFDPQKDNAALRAHAHMKMREVAYFLQRLDECQDANGKSLLENSLITISTESGDGRHNDVKRELSGVFHAISSGGGRFKTGEIMDVGAEGIDVYNTLLEAMGASQRLGPPQRDARHIDRVLV